MKRAAIASAILILGLSFSSVTHPGRAQATTSQSRTMTGPGFDICTDKLTVANINDLWSFSPYWTAGTYFGGLAAVCDIESYGGDGIWFQELNNVGFQLIPYWLDYQSAARTGGPVGSILCDGSNAWSLGWNSGDRAVNEAWDDGIHPGATLTLDIEHWNENANCDWAMYIFALNWTTRVQIGGYKAVLYGDDLNMKALMDYDAYVNVWYAGTYHRFDGIIMTGVSGSSPPLVDPLPDAWDNFFIGKRAHQYSLDHNETWGSSTVHINNLCLRGLWTAGINQYNYPSYGGILCTYVS